MNDMPTGMYVTVAIGKDEFVKSRLANLPIFYPLEIYLQ